MLSEKSAEEARLVELPGGADQVVMESGMDGRMQFARPAPVRPFPAHTKARSPWN